MAEKKTLSVVVIEPTVVDGEHHAIGAELEVDVELAYILAGSGKARLATEADKKAADGKKKKAADGKSE